MTEKTALARFGEKQLAAFKALSDLKKTLKELEEKEKEIKASIQDAMEHYNVTDFQNQYISLKYIYPTETVTIDLTQLQNNEPELYEELLHDYPKKVTKKGYVRFTVR